MSKGRGGQDYSVDASFLLGVFHFTSIFSISCLYDFLLFSTKFLLLTNTITLHIFSCFSSLQAYSALAHLLHCRDIMSLLLLLHRGESPQSFGLPQTEVRRIALLFFTCESDLLTIT